MQSSLVHTNAGLRPRVRILMHRNISGAGVAVALLAAGLLVAAPSHADPDIEFANELHSFGVYGPRDYNAWIGKIACQRLDDGVDGDASKSAQFVMNNLARGSTTAQAWQFLGTAIDTYCPDQLHVLQGAAAHRTSS